MNRRIHTASAAALAVALVSFVGARFVNAGGNPNPVELHGSVSGIVRLDGAAPKPSHISMSNDPSCAKQHPGGALAQDVVVDPDGALENVVVFISEGLPPKTFDPPVTPATIEQKGCMYQPHVLALQAKQELEVINEDATLHNIHPMPQNNREWNKSQPPGMQPVIESFPRQEVAIPVKCNVHPWMRSYIAVFNHPYFAVTAKEGNFDIRNLPPGTYTIQAWHEKFGMLTKKITVKGDESEKVDFAFKSTASN